MAETEDAAGLADAIFNLWSTPGLAADLGRNGAQGVREHYSATRMATRALEAYQAVAAAQTVAGDSSVSGQRPAR